MRRAAEKEVQALTDLGVQPSLVAVEVGSHPASDLYMKRQERACSRTGIGYQRLALPSETSERGLLRELGRLNHREDVTGVILQMPLPGHISARKAREAIAPNKDIEGIHPQNLGRLLSGQPGLAPCTAEAAVECILSTNCAIEGSEVVVVGHSEIVGKPVALLLMERLATVTVCHHATVDLAQHTLRADILVVAVGKPGLIHGKDIKPGAVVVDVGINEVPQDGKMKVVGDVDFDSAKSVAGWLSPVPGGVGPVTVANLVANTARAAARQGSLFL